MKKLFALFLFLLLFQYKSLGQQKDQLSNDTTQFISDLNIYFIDNTGSRIEAENYLRDFIKNWENNYLAGYFKEIIIKTSNLMVNKKLKPNPFFLDYFDIVYNYLESGQTSEKFEKFQTCLELVLKNKGNKAVQSFLELGENAFKENILYKSPSYVYFLGDQNYTFEYDNDPKIVFENSTIVGMNPRADSISIEKTKGIYYPTTGIFIGKGGIVSWERTGLSKEVYAKLKNYKIDCKTGAYTSDSALFTGKQYFDKPQLGTLSDRIRTEPGEKNYPRFDSYGGRLTVKDIYPDIDYEGGFAMRGAKFVGSGSAASPARLVIKYENKRFMEISSSSFGMSPEKIIANPAYIKFNLQKDSIVHSNISFIYQVEKRRVTLLRSDDGLQKMPFTNSFHRLDMHFEQLVWNIDDPKIDFNFLPNNMQGEAFFESANFFNSSRYESLQKHEKENLVKKLIEYSGMVGEDSTFTVVDFAKYIKYLAVDLRPTIYKFAITGLISYNPKTDLIRPKHRLFHYYENYRHKMDYDIITFHSVNPGKDNASLNLINNSYDLKIMGVKQILLSDTQKVFVFPKNGEIIVKKNRDFTFDGVISSGKFEFHGKNYLFKYDPFKIQMNTIDSIRIYVIANEKDINGSQFYKRVRTVIENVNGELRIDGPTNKSGWKKAPSFPQFESFKESYTFYDKRSTYKSVYNRDNFYFKLDPFKFDSLDNFQNEGIKFDGLFSSANIFPSFRETLTLQKDYSLGFIRKTPEGGMPLYGGKANYDAEIRLSDKGLRGSGDLKFGPSLSKSNDFIFFPDSTNAVAQTFDVQEQDNPNQFPKTHGDTVYIHFKPYQDLLQARDLKRPFDMYKEGAKFSGRYDLTKTQLTGNGKVDFEKADLSSLKILFIKRKFFADTANFHLKAHDDDGFTFSTINVNATIDFDERFGQFVTNGAGSYVRFDKNQYIAYMDRFKWYMDKEELDLGDDKKKIEESTAENALDLEGPAFISIHPKQDSLKFFAPAAKYNTRKYIIYCKNVPFINVADARIYPDNGDVTIFKKAVMDTLKKAKMMANTVTRYHNIRNVTANIFGRYSYLANGDYNYVDENENSFKIKFDKIEPDTGRNTVATGSIAEKDKFKFNDYFSFAGNVRLEANNEYLFFDGGTQIVHGCKHIKKSYLKFNGEINPKDILIPIPEDAVDMNGKPVVNAMMYSLDTTGIYTGFLSLKNARSDHQLIKASGFLTYDTELKEYQISNKEKLVEDALPGNYLSLNVEKCQSYGEGKFDLGVNLGQLELNSVGNAKHFLNDSADLNLMMTVNFFFEDKALKSMAKDLQIYLNSAEPTDFTADLYTKGLAEFVGKDKADNLIAEVNLDGSFRKYPSELNKTFFFNKVKMKYDQRRKAFISIGDVGVGNILKNDINRDFKGKIKIDKTRNKRDKITIYIEPDVNTWYFFEFINGTMKAISSNNEFNTIIKEMKSKNRKQKVEKGPSFQFTIGSEAAKKNFVRNFMEDNDNSAPQEEEE
ncbi:MAG: hypothetical protein AB7O73_10660 [Bacteroidia bacterium]